MVIKLNCAINHIEGHFCACLSEGDKSHKLDNSWQAGWNPAVAVVLVHKPTNHHEGGFFTREAGKSQQLVDS